MRIVAQVRFIETSEFTREVVKHLTDEQYRQLQNALIANPALGAVIQGTGGVRKLRWRDPSRGKRGGLRVIYYWHVPGSTILFLLAYPKNEQDDLTPAQLKALKAIIQTEYP